MDIHYPCGCSNVIKFEHDPSNLNFDSLSFYMDNSEIQKINEFLNAIYKDDINQIHFAIEKYMSSTERKSPYDKILDFVIAQEILLGKGDGVDSIKYKICNRLINCLTNDYNQRMLIYKKFSILYDIRSIIVHNTLKKKINKILIFVLRT